MTIARVQSVIASGFTAATAWGSTPVSGNLLLIVANAVVSQTGATLLTAPSGWNSANHQSGAGASHVMNTTNPTLTGLFWKIAGASETTPASFSDNGSGGSPSYIGYQYEFSSTTGWAVSPEDQEAHSAVPNPTSQASRTSGATGTLAQAEELGIGAFFAAGTLPMLAPNAGWTQDGAATGRLNVAYQFTAATTALTYTQSTSGTSEVSEARVWTFMSAPPPVTLTAAGAWPGMSWNDHTSGVKF